MAKFLVAIALTAVACMAAPKERAWQNGRLLDSRDTHYFTAAEIADGATIDGFKNQYGDIEYSTNTTGAVATVYQNFMFESADTVYLVQVGRLRTARPIHVSLLVPIKFAVEKNKFYFVDQEGVEYPASILKQAATHPVQVAQQQPAKSPAPAQAGPKPAPAPAPTPAPTVVAVKAPDPAPVAVKPAAPAAKDPVKPAPAPKPEPVVVAKQVQPPPPAVVRPAPAPAVAPAPKPEPKPEPVAKAEPKPQPPAPKPAPKVETPAPPAVRVEASKNPVKDRAWQSGQLLSTVSNSYFVNVNYTTDTDAGTWTMVQGNDGRYTLVSQTRPTPNNFTYDNYVIESQFCAYLVQRWRGRTAPMAKFPGTTPLRFAVEKNKMYVLDETGKEYETVIVKLVQRDAIDTHTHVAVER